MVAKVLYEVGDFVAFMVEPFVAGGFVGWYHADVSAYGCLGLDDDGYEDEEYEIDISCGHGLWYLGHLCMMRADWGAISISPPCIWPRPSWLTRP